MLIPHTENRMHQGPGASVVTRVRVVRDDGQLLRELTLDPSRDYRPLGTPRLVHDVVRYVEAVGC